MTWYPGSLVSLETERFRLNSIEREDANETLAEWLADPEVMLGLNLPRRRLSRADLVSYATSYDNTRRFCLMVRPKDGDNPIGLFTATADQKNLIAETAVVIGDRFYWGRDVVREARPVIIDFLFEELGMHKIMGRTHSRNFSSIFNYKVLGFKCEGVLREQLRTIDGKQWLDQVIFGMLREEWHNRGERQTRD